MAAPRLSATVMLVRDGDDGLEVFMVRRHDRSPAMPGAYVFPGGTVSPADTEAARSWLKVAGDAVGARSDEPIDALTSAALQACAVRELFEEAGVLLAYDAGGRSASVPEGEGPLQARLRQARAAMQRGEVGLGSVLADAGWRPAFADLRPFSHWVTPDHAPARFDTWFFIAEMPPGQQAIHCDVETTDGRWLRPAAALAGAESGWLNMIFPTVMHLQRLTRFDRAADLVDFARSKPIRRVQPVWRVRDGAPDPWLPEDIRDGW